MRRTVLLNVLLTVLLLTGCGAQPEAEQVPPARAAEPQQAALGWRESYPTTGQQLRFDVDDLVVGSEGWSVGIAITNATLSTFELGANSVELSFGLMLFASGDLAELEEASRNGSLPAVRLAATIVPAPPDVLAPGQVWRATLASPGSLADGSYLRVAFGPLRAVGEPPPGMQQVVYWITDRSHRL